MTTVGHAQKGLLVVLFTAPWLWPPVGGPSPSVQPILLALACAGLAVLLAPAMKVRGLAGVTLIVAGAMAWAWSRGALFGELAALWIVACALVVAQRLRTVSWVAVMADAWLLAALLSSVVALLQYFAMTAVLPFITPAQPGEAFGQLRQRNQLATLLSLGVVALMWRAARLEQQDKTALRGPSVLAAVLLATASAASGSRTSALQLAAIGLLAWRVYRKSPTVRRLLVVTVLAYLVAAFVLPVVAPADAGVQLFWSRLDVSDEGCIGRLTLWSNMWQLMQQRPWTGWGWGELAFAHVMTDFEGPRFCLMPDNAHNLLLHLAVELGVPVALGLSLTALWVILKARPWLEQNHDKLLAWFILVMLAIHSQLEYPLWYGPFQLALGLALGLLWPEQDATRQGKAMRIHQGLAAALGVAAIIAAGYAAWDYHRISQLYLPPSLRAPAYQQQTLEKARASRLFAPQVAFAEFTTTPLTEESAQRLYDLGEMLVHYSPERRVLEKLSASALATGRVEAARFYRKRLDRVYPQHQAD